MATPEDRDLAPLLRRGRHGLGSVYPDLRVIEATWRLLEERSEVTIPAMNRDLVERATHPEALAGIETGLGKEWGELGRRLSGKTAAQRGLAALHGIDRSKPFGELSFCGLDEVVRTRLGADDRLVEWEAAVSAPPEGPFGNPVRAITIPAHLCKGVAVDAEPSPPGERPDGFTFTLGNRVFHYGRHGLTVGKEGEEC